MKLTRACAVGAVFAFAATGMGSADGALAAEGEEIGTRVSVDAGQYIEASSPEDADAKFAALREGGAAARGVPVKYGPCTLYPTPTYLRTSSKKKNVGAKPRTECSVPVSSIHHASDLRYKSFIWWKKAGSTHTGGNQNESKYEQKNVEYRCVSSEQTGWSGTTAGTIVYGGKKYYARVYFTEESLKCGG